MCGKMAQHIAAFGKNQRGGAVIIFALALPVALGLVAFATTYEARNAQATAAQSVLDGAALAAVTTFQAGTGEAGGTTIAKSYLNAGTSAIPDIAANSKISFDNAKQSVTISYSSSTPLKIGSTLLGASLPVNVTSTAALGGSQRTPVCILITDYDAGHTLKTKNSSKLDIYNCMVQVNTNDWDAVQADDNSYIHINTPDEVGNWNCYVGDIHFGDVKPEKQRTCTLLPDPLTKTTLPSASSQCTDSSNYNITNVSHTFNPGTYCGDIKVTGNANVTFNPGIYYIAGGSVNIGGSGDVLARGVVFVLTDVAASAPIVLPGDSDGVPARPSSAKAGPAPRKAGKGGAADGQFNISTSGNVTMTPYTGAAAPVLNGFILFQDPSLFSDWTCACGQTVNISNATLTTSGGIYLVDDVLLLKGAKWTHTGTLVADMFLPEGNSTVKLHGDPQSVITKATVMTPALMN